MLCRTRLHGNLRFIVTLVPIVNFLSFLFSRPPTAQERQGALLVLTSPSVSHTDQSLPDPISPWTCSAIEAFHPFIPFTHSVLIRPPPPPTPSPSALAASPASVQPSRSTCVHHGDKAERGRKSVPLICAAGQGKTGSQQTLVVEGAIEG